VADDKTGMSRCSYVKRNIVVCYMADSHLCLSFMTLLWMSGESDCFDLGVHIMIVNDRLIIEDLRNQRRRLDHRREKDKGMLAEFTSDL
jgi:hypothetical protein